MEDFLIEVINVIPSYYPFTEKDGSIGLADFYAQKPVSKEKNIHEDAVYRDFKRNCDIIGVPVGPCNKLIRGSNLDCIRTPPPVQPPPPICINSDNGIALPCKCGCPASCLYRSGRQSDYIEDWDRQELLNIIDAVRSFPQIDNVDDNDTAFDDNYQREITHELAGNAYWIGLPPSCDGIWITIVDCASSEFAGFYELSSSSFGIQNGVELKGRGQRIKILGEDGLYKKYQVYYAYEFEHKLEIRPPGEMTFKLADSNIVELAENDNEVEPGAPDNYSRFCYDDFVKFITRNCVSFTDAKGSFNDVPCVCDEPFNTNLDPHVSERYVLKRTIPSKILNYGVFSIENEETGYCMNAAFERDPITVEGASPSIDPFIDYQYYDAFSGKIIDWDQIDSETTDWANSDRQDDWYSWTESEAFDAYVWDSTKIKENCYECLTDKKNQNNRTEIPPCENVMCGRIEINASPSGSAFDAWEAADGPEAGYKVISSDDMLEWDMFSKFGFPTLAVYNPSASFENNGKWYDEMKERFVEAGEFDPERNQFTIPCFPTLVCPDNNSRVSNIIDISIPCSSVYGEETESTTTGAEGTIHKIYVGVDYRPTEGCSPCSSCTPSGCCHSEYGFYNIVSSSIGKSFYYPVYSDTDDSNRLEEALEMFQVPFLQCNNTKCSPEDLEATYVSCLDFNDNPTEEEIENCIEEALKECESSLEEFICEPPVNIIDTSKISRISEGIWEYDGQSILDCVSPPGISAPFNCVYEIKPIRPSATYWSDVNVGQCLVRTELTDDCGPCSRTYQNIRKDPIYAVGSGQDGCPTTFCNKCFNGTESRCSCCSVNRLIPLEENPLRVSQSSMFDCESCTGQDPFGNSTCCPDCCSLCDENGLDTCGDTNIRPDWQSDCNTDPCGWSYWDFKDCGLENSIFVKEIKGDTCIDGNACNPPAFPDCSYDDLDGKCDIGDEFPKDNIGSSNGGFGDDGSFNTGGGVGL